MNAKTIMCASCLALAAGLLSSAPASAALTLLVAAGGGGGEGVFTPGVGAGQITQGGQAGENLGGAGGVNGLGGAAGAGAGGAGWLGNGGGSGGGLSSPTFAGGISGAGAVGGFGGGGAGVTVIGGGGGGGYSGGGGGSDGGSGGGGGSYVNPALADVIESPDFNGTPTYPAAPENGYVIVGLEVFDYTGSIVQYVIPQTGAYYVAAIGAQGGIAFGNAVAPGYGAGVGGTVFLDEGTVLDIVVGGAGGEGFGASGGGGGGSFVWDPAAVPAQPVPEPSTWALVLTGFAGLGFLVQRRQRARASVAAEPRGRPC